MTAGYSLCDVDLFAPGSEWLRLRPEADAAGLGCILRDGAAVVGFRLFATEDIPPEGLGRDDLLDPAAREASAYARLRTRLSAGIAPTPPRISVAICTKDRPDWLDRLLSSLTLQRRVHGFEILVVDNNSENPEVRRVAEAADTVYVREAKTGLDFARNTAMRRASGDIVAFLDDDTTVEPEWFDNLARTWAENPDAGCVTGLVLPMSLDSPAKVLFEKGGGFRRAMVPRRFAKAQWRNQLYPCGAGEFGAGANMSLNRSLVMDLGGFDDALDTGRPLPGGGDLDIFYRVLRAGRTLVYDPGVVVRHDHRADLAVLRHQYYTWGLGFFAFLAKSQRTDPRHKPALSAMRRWWWSHMPYRFLRSIIGRDPLPPSMIAAEIWGGLKGGLGEYERSQKRTAQIRERTA